MEEKKQYLTEKNYEKGKKTIFILAFLILIVGLTIGGLLIYKGVDNKQNVNNTTNDQEVKDKARLVEIEKEKEELNQKILAKEYECDSMDMKSDNWFAEKNKCDSEVSSLRQQLNKLELEEFELEHNDYEFDKKFNSFDSTKYFMFGGFIIIVTLMISGSLFMFVKRREIIAFSAQQVMPVAQEGIEKMAEFNSEKIVPIAKKNMETMAPAIGQVAKEIKKGIEEAEKESE